MKMRLTIVPTGGGEADFSREVDLPAVPRAGDPIILIDPQVETRGVKHGGIQAFTVVRSWWEATFDDQHNQVSSNLAVECEYSDSGWASESHRAHYEAQRVGHESVHPNSGY